MHLEVLFQYCVGRGEGRREVGCLGALFQYCGGWGSKKGGGVVWVFCFNIAPDIV